MNRSTANKLRRYEEALREIIDPISFMRTRAKKTGHILDGAMAVQLSNDPRFLKALAVAALKSES